MSKPSVLHGGSLLKPPSYSAQGRHPYEDIKNGGLDFVKAAVSVIRHGDCLLNDGFFSFAVARQLQFLMLYSFRLIFLRLIFRWCYDFIIGGASCYKCHCKQNHQCEYDTAD